MAQKVYVSKFRKATFSCPKCGLVKEKDVSKFVGLKSTVRIKCRCVCGHAYPVIFERRQHIRKTVNFSGSYVRGKKDGYFFVKDISRTGMKLKMMGPIEVAVGDRILTRFVLDDAAGSEVEKEVVVRNIMPPMLGVEFTSLDHYGKLGAYLLYAF